MTKKVEWYYKKNKWYHNLVPARTIYTRNEFGEEVYHVQLSEREIEKLHELLNSGEK